MESSDNGPNVVFFEASEADQTYLQARLQTVAPVFLTELLNRSSAHAARDAEVASVFIHSRVDSETLNLLPRLRCIATDPRATTISTSRPATGAASL